MKKTIKLTLFAGMLIVLAVVGCSNPSGDGSSTSASMFTYDEIGGKITITGYYGPGGAVKIPAKIEGKPVIALKSYSGYSLGVFFNSGLTSVTIPNSITSIGDYAFSGTLLTSVTIPDSVTYLSGFNSTQLTSITIPNSVTTIGVDAFLYCTSLTSVTIPNSVTTIGNSAFYGCTNLSSVTIGNNVKTIEAWAFNNNGLTSVTIPNSVTTIEPYAFWNNDLTSITIGANVTIATYAIDSFFYYIYNDGGKLAGTYQAIAISPYWVKQL